MLLLLIADCNVGATSVTVVEESIETVLCSCPDENSIIYVPFPYVIEWVSVVCVNKVLLEYAHEGVGMSGCCFGADDSAAYL